MSTRATPYSLVYGMEAVLPVEVEIPSLRVLLDVKLDEAGWIRTRFNELSLIEERRLAAVCHGQLYQRRMKRAFDQKVRPRIFQTGDKSEASGLRKTTLPFNSLAHRTTWL